MKPNKYKKLKHLTLRGQIKGTTDRSWWSVYRSNEKIYAQRIDDTTSETLISCATLDCSIKSSLSNDQTCNASRLMGEQLARLSSKKNITKIVFNRGPHLYHGCIKVLADGAQASDLQFKIYY